MKFPSLRHKKIIRVLEVRQTGSHLILLNQESKKIISVPIHNKDIKKGLLIGIIKQAGLTTEEFIKML